MKLSPLALVLWGAALTQGLIPLPVEESRILRPATAEEREVGEKLLAGLMAVEAVPPDYLRAAQAFRLPPQDRLPVSRVVLLLAGEELDAADNAEVTRAELDQDMVRVVVSYTSERLKGVKLRRNVLWRPILALPLTLAPGSYQVEVHWQAVDRLPDGHPLEAPARVHRAVLSIGPQ